MDRRVWTALLATTLLAAACTDDPTAPGAPEPPEILRVEVAPDEVWLETGDTVRLAATAYGASGSPVAGVAVTWATGSPASLRVQPSGATALVTALAPGFATVTATAGGKSNDATFLVEAPEQVGSIELEPEQVILMVGQELDLQATVLSQTGEIMDGSAVVWSLDDHAVASVVPAGQPGRVRITALAEGVAVLSAEVGDVVTGVGIQVMAAGPAAHSVELDLESLTVEVNKTVPLHAWVYGMDGMPVEDPVLTWTTSDPTVAMVAGHPGGRGDVVARAPGVVTVHAWSGGQVDSARVTVVTPPAVHSVYLGNRTAWSGSSVAFEATVVGPGGILADAPVAWSVEDPTVAEIDARGWARGIRAGSTRVWAESGGVRGSATLTVRAWPADGKVRFTLRVATDPWGTPRLHGPMGTTTWTDSTGVAKQASLWLAGGSVEFHGDGTYTRIIEVDVQVPGFGGILVRVERRTQRSTGRVAHDYMSAWTFHLVPDAGGPAIGMESLEPGAWVTQEAFGTLPLLPWRWDMP